MTMIQYMKGDLFAAVQADQDPQTIIIPHVCNDEGVMGSGFVVPLAKTWPVVKQDYYAWANGDGKYKNVPFQLGMTQFVEVKKEGQPLVIVANMVAQILGGRRPLHYNMLAKCMETVDKQVEIHKARIIAPMFGAGLAGGNWLFIKDLIEDCWLRKRVSVTIYYLDDMATIVEQLPK